MYIPGSVQRSIEKIENTPGNGVLVLVDYPIAKVRYQYYITKEIMYECLKKENEKKVYEIFSIDEHKYTCYFAFSILEVMFGEYATILY